MGGTISTPLTEGPTYDLESVAVFLEAPAQFNHGCLRVTCPEKKGQREFSRRLSQGSIAGRPRAAVVPHDVSHFHVAGLPGPEGGVV